MEKPKKLRKKRTRTPLRRSHSRRYGIRLSKSLLEAIDCHRFTGEADSCLIERLLTRLVQSGVPRTYYEPKVEAKLPQVFGFSASLDIERLIDKEWQGDREHPKRGDSSKTITYLLWLASSSPVVQEISSADEALALLKENLKGRVRSPDVIKLLTQRCSYEKAVEWLLELGDRGDLWLVSVDSERHQDDAVLLGGRKVGAIVFFGDRSRGRLNSQKPC